MKRTTTGIALGLGTTLAATFAFAGLAAAAPGNGPGNGNGRGPFGTPTTTPTASATQAVASDELKADLRYMRDEERLAKEIYAAAVEKYDGALPFANIVNSEQKHFDAVGMLLTRYGIDDPARDATVGVYSDPKLQAEYDKLLAMVNESLDQAYQAGIAIEKMDIADLEAAIARTGELDVKRVFGNLLNGSRNHLQAFEAAANGETLGQHDGSGQQNGRGAQGGQGRQRGAGQQDGTCDGSEQQRRGQAKQGQGQGMKGQQQRQRQSDDQRGQGQQSQAKKDQGMKGQGRMAGQGGQGQGQGRQADCPKR